MEQKTPSRFPADSQPMYTTSLLNVATCFSCAVQGSTELWEWNMELTAEGLQLHDRLMRELMGAFYGYEVSTEGDAFLVAFHEPFDAVAWCLATQLALHCKYIICLDLI